MEVFSLIRRSILPVLCLLFLVSAGHAQGNSLLWKISGNGLPEVSFLYGTIHLLCPEDLQISETVTNSLSASKQLVLELDFDDPALMQKLQAGMMRSDTVSAFESLTPADFEKLDAFFKENYGMSLKNGPFATLKPFFLYSLIIPKMIGCTPASYEISLTGLAQKNNQEVLGLETVEEQIAVSDQLPEQEVLRMMLEEVKQPDSSREEFRRLVQRYKAQDIKALSRLTEEYTDIEGFEEFMLADRNRNWIDRMKSLMEKNSTFFAVGAAHLGGEAGLIRLLQKVGYTVEPVP